MRSTLGGRGELRRKIAESSPGSLFLRGFFWGKQHELALIVVASLISFVILAPYTYDFAHGWVFLTIFIQLLVIWAAFITLKGLAKLEVESAIVGEIESRGEAYLGYVKSGQGDRVSLEQLEENILPHNRSMPAPSMIRLFQHIFKEAKDRKFESSFNVIQPYREEVLEDIFRLQNIQKIALWLGILGTFVGLLRAIQFGDMKELQASDNLPEIVTRMFDSLFISFSASLAGLEVAVIIGAFLLLLRRRHVSYFQNMESAVVTMLSLARNATNKDDFFVEFSQVRHSLDALKGELYHQTKELSGGMETVRGRVEKQTEQIQAGVNKLAESSQTFDRFLTQLSENQRQMLDDVKSVYDAISLRNLGTTLQEGIAKAGQHISATLDPNVTQISTRIAKFNETLSALSDVLQLQAREAAAQREELKAWISRQAEQSANAQRMLDRRLQDGLGKLESSNSKLLTLDLAELSRRISALNATLEKSVKRQQTRRFSLREFFSR
jgi:methyl-accepting chemotaxis protein